jgi:hypothetical protein
MPEAVVFDGLGTVGVLCGGSPEDSRLPPQSSVLVLFAVVGTVRNLAPSSLASSAPERSSIGCMGPSRCTPLGLTVPFSRSGRLGLLTAGRELLADAVAPAGLRCRLAL